MFFTTTKKKKKKKKKAGFFDKLFDTSKPIPKSGSKKFDQKIAKQLKESGGKCFKCKTRSRSGTAGFCRKCLKEIWSFKGKS